MSGYYGRAEAMGHAGEILQGAVRRPGGVEPFLVTLPAPMARSAARVSYADAWSVAPAWKSKALRVAQLACARWEVGEALAIEIHSAIPVGRGCGSSTADCVATVRAISALMGRECPAAEIARLTAQAEVASDSTMFDLTPVAFLPRRGELLRRYDCGWPAMHITVVDLGGPDVETLACPVPAYSRGEVEEFDVLLDQLQRALLRGDAAAVGRIASRSATIHQRYRPHPRWASLQAEAMAMGAYGIAVAHSGTVAAVLADGPLPIGSISSYALGGIAEGVEHVHPAGWRR